MTNDHERPVPAVGPEEAERLRQAGTPMLDLRDELERRGGFPPGSIICHGQDVATQAASLLADKGSLLVICARGLRSARLVESLAADGMDGALSVSGGFDAWRAAGLPIEGAEGLSPVEIERYARHLVLPEVGAEGQVQLLRSRVLLVGAGGLGSPAALYLAAAGIGEIGIVDDDHVERSNLQRQVLHDDSQVGEPKSSSARRRLLALNPQTTIREIRSRVVRENAVELLRGWDLVIDGSDNFPTRYAVNEACVQLDIPLVYGAVQGFRGQLSVFWPAGPAGGPCYRCLFPEAPGPGEAPNCSEAGVLGVLPGIIGALQAAEAFKVLLGRGQLLVGRLLHFDALQMAFRESRIRPDPACRSCGGR